jgi:hypothetical protein
MWSDPTKYHFVKFDDAEFFYPWGGGFLVGGLWGFGVSSEATGRFLRRFVSLQFWCGYAGLIIVFVGAKWLGSFGFFLAGTLALILINSLLLVPSLRRLPRLPPHLSLHLYAEHVGEYDLKKLEFGSLLMSLLSFALSAFWISPVMNATVFSLAVFFWVNAVFASLVQRQFRDEPTSTD